MNRKITLTGANIVFFVFTIVFITYQVILAIVMQILGKNINDYLYTIVLINEFVMILGPVLIYCLVKKINIKEVFRFNKPGIIPMLLVAAISLPAYFVAALLNNVLIYFLQFIGDLPATPIPVPQNLSELLVGILIIAVSPGICEEIMHRGFLLRAYEKRGSYKAAFIVSIYFGIFHFDITNFFGPVFLGLIFGYYAIRTNSIFPSMLAHFLNNTIAEILQFISRNQVIPDKLTVSWPDLQQLVLIGFVCLIITAALMVLFKKVTEDRAVITPSITTAGRDAKAILSHWPVILVLVIYFLMMLLYIFSVIMLKFSGG
jgi:membrane protease YdiL (CAAX protease family)